MSGSHLFGSELRYDYLPQEEKETTPFDRDAAIKLAKLSIDWAAKIVPVKG